MSDSAADLIGFAYGEDLEGVSQRSLGYRLLAPLQGEPWCAEVEALARRLQAAPYSDHWPAADLFCSVLLADGRRLAALARYGLSDHTPSRRRGGLELIGVVGPGSMGVSEALAVYHWLRQRRADCDDLHRLGGRFNREEVRATAVPPLSPSDPVPVLPVRLWQEGALLFAASTPADPDHHLRLLEQGAGAAWQWLPLVGADFPLTTYAQRGPLVAWTPHLAGVALKLDRKSSEAPAPVRPRPSSLARIVIVSLLLLVAGLLAGNLWALHGLHHRLDTAPPPAAVGSSNPSPPAANRSDAGREQFVAALHAVLAEQGARGEMEAGRDRLLARYESLAREHKDLRLPPDDVEGRVTLGAISVLAGRSSGRIEEVVRQALSEDKGFSPRLIRAACDHVREEFVAEGKGRR